MTNLISNFCLEKETFFEEGFFRSSSLKGVAGGEGGKSPTQTEKIVVEKWCFSDGSIFSNKFSKKKKN